MDETQRYQRRRVCYSFYLVIFYSQRKDDGKLDMYIAVGAFNPNLAWPNWSVQILPPFLRLPHLPPGAHINSSVPFIQSPPLLCHQHHPNQPMGTHRY